MPRSIQHPVAQLGVGACALSTLIARRTNWLAICLTGALLHGLPGCAPHGSALVGVEGRGGSVAGEANAAPEVTAMRRPLLLSIGRGPLSARAHDSIVSFRGPIAAPAGDRAKDAPPAAMRARLARIAEALEQDDAALALATAESAATEFPDRVEPLEMAMLAHIRSEDSRGVSAVIGRIGAIDPASPFVSALAGLRAAAEGDSAACLAALSWFVGPDGLPRRGRMVPLFAVPGELEEQAAFAALRLGHTQAALEALDAAIAARVADERRVAMLGLLRADALEALGRAGEAREQVTRAASSPAASTALGALAALRLDSMPAAADQALQAAVANLLEHPRDDVALWRVASLAANLGSVAGTPLRGLEQLDRARAALGPVRHAIAAAAIDPAHRTQPLDDALLDVSDVGEPIDRVAFVLSLRHLARFQPDRVLPLASFTAEWRPNDLDAVANALLACGRDVDATLSQIDALRDRPSSAALRSRILGRYGFAEEAFAAASDGRRTWPNSKVLRVAEALAAVDLGDATLLAQVDDVARRDDGSTDRTMALAWFALQEMPTARSRASAAVAFDARDRSARLCAALASLEDPSLCEGAAEAVRVLAQESDALGAEAWSMRAEVEAGSRVPTQGRVDWPACTNAVAALRALASECESLRIPLAGECLALAEEVEPSTRSMQAITRIRVGTLVPPTMAAWTREIVAAAPALPERRRLAFAEGGSVGAIPATPLSARFDALCRAAPDEVQRERERLRALRPSTPVAESIEISARVERGDGDGAEARVAALVSADDERLPALAARRVLLAMRALAVEMSEGDPARAKRLQSVLVALIGRCDRLSPADILEANRIHLATEHGPSETESFERLLADRARPMLAAESDACLEAIGSVARMTDDPFAAARLAEFVCMQQRIGAGVRARLATAAIALAIGAGDGADEITTLIDRLLAAGAAPWPSDAAESNAMPPTARALVRASEVFALLGSDQEARTLLESALAVAPDAPEILNGLAYGDLERGELGERTIAFAERAARARPDDPATLDTIGCVRYHQGRFRDDGGGPGAISLFRQALRLRPNSPSLETLDHLGDALWRAGEQDGAVKSWQQVAAVARKRYPPELFAARMRSFQLKNFGFELVSVGQFVRREYGLVVGRAQRKLEEVAGGRPPSVAECQATR